MHDHQSQLFCFVCYLLLASQSTCYFFKHIIFSAEEMSVRQEESELGFEYVILIIPESNVDASQRVYFVAVCHVQHSNCLGGMPFHYVPPNLKFSQKKKNNKKTLTYPLRSRSLSASGLPRFVKAKATRSG